jgi:hypothetical protein
MANSGLLRAVCTVALLAATPALAQQTMTPPASAASPAAQSGSGGPSTETMAPKSAMAPKDSMAQKDTMGAKTESSTGTSHASTMAEHPMHHHAMASHYNMHASRTDSSQDAAVNKLNEQSYHAAEQGQSFSIGNPVTGMGNTTPADGSSKMGGTSGRKM